MISHFKPEAEFLSDERCYIVELHGRAEDEGCSVARARVLPGVTTRLHALRGIEERYVILSGEGRVEVNGGAPEAVRPLDVVLIPAGQSQRISNTGTSELVFLCVCSPRFRQEAYVDLSPAE